MLQEVGLFYSSHQIVYRASTKLWSHLQRLHEFLNYVELKQAAFRSPRHWYLSEKRL
jgi:hypothetical protein